jgi:hypothetical protein
VRNTPKTTFRDCYLSHPQHQYWCTFWAKKTADHVGAQTHPRESYFTDRIAAQLLEFNATFSVKSAQALYHWCRKARAIQPPLSEPMRQMIASFQEWLLQSGRVGTVASVTQ